MRGFLSSVPAGDAGTLATVQAMRTLARRGAIDPVVRQQAALAVRGVPGDWGTEHASILRDWITRRTYYLADPTYTEALHEPGWQVRSILTLGNVGVDCDDVATLAAAMGLAIGLRARFVIVGFTSPNAPFRHVWTELASASRPEWVPIDPTRPVQAIARLPISRVRTVEV